MSDDWTLHYYTDDDGIHVRHTPCGASIGIGFGPSLAEAAAAIKEHDCPMGSNPKPTVHEVMLSQGIDRQRLSEALAAKDNWGKMIHAFEFLTASSAVLATWPEE